MALGLRRPRQTARLRWFSTVRGFSRTRAPTGRRGRRLRDWTPAPGFNPLGICENSSLRFSGLIVVLLVGAGRGAFARAFLSQRPCCPHAVPPGGRTSSRRTTSHGELLRGRVGYCKRGLMVKGDGSTPVIVLPGRFVHAGIIHDYDTLPAWSCSAEQRRGAGSSPPASLPAHAPVELPVSSAASTI